ncbi:hypothetical protein JRO89_XSUnG0095500 [Xanthoceras sorbifolium]|uniref:C-JID domain-containing protein n=1 Tax=Xanthoceras sorbifolium TaxID=99658 RepID=A0ABQ8GYS3_9ROSI|nr:hypothetical protein JRO89_XSUnG0095500 [Xanthoceras sorbifolium]
MLGLIIIVHGHSSEAKLIKDIVGDVSRRLDQKFSSIVGDLVGICSRLKEIYEGSQAVEGIMRKKSKQESTYLDGKSFSNLRNLRLLKISSNVHLLDDLENSLFILLKWFTHWSEGPEVQIGQSPNWFNIEFMGFTVCAVISNPCNWCGIRLVYKQDLKYLKEVPATEGPIFRPDPVDAAMVALTYFQMPGILEKSNTDVCT